MAGPLPPDTPARVGDTLRMCKLKKALRLWVIRCGRSGTLWGHLSQMQRAPRRLIPGGGRRLIFGKVRRSMSITPLLSPDLVAVRLC